MIYIMNCITKKERPLFNNFNNFSKKRKSPKCWFTIQLREKINKPARVPAAAARLRPFFFKIKLVPINKLDDIARINPLVLSEIVILFLTSSAKIKMVNYVSNTKSQQKRTTIKTCLNSKLQNLRRGQIQFPAQKKLNYHLGKKQK